MDALHTDPELPAPSNWLASHLPRAGSRARALDLACGGGRHALHMARAGFNVLAVDRSQELLDLLSRRWAAICHAKDVPAEGGIVTSCMELEGQFWPLTVDAFGQWDLIVVTNYLHRPHLGKLPPMLAPGGCLIYETFAVGNAEYGRPSNPEFLLRPDELLEFAHAHGLEVLDFAQGYVEHPKPAVTQRICATRRALG